MLGLGGAARWRLSCILFMYSKPTEDKRGGLAVLILVLVLWCRLFGVLGNVWCGLGPVTAVGNIAKLVATLF